MTKSIAKPAPSQRLLNRILDAPQLVGVIQHLPARVLGRVIDEVGLEDAGELVALATTEQLRALFDEDLWRSERPGQDEQFDADRFALWLEVLLEAGPAFAAEKLSALDEDLVTLALCHHLLVVDNDALAVTMSEAERSDEADLTDKALESCLSQEFEEFQIIARDPDTWDPIIHVLVELDRTHHALLRRLLERCCEVTNAEVEENGGLYQVLTSGETLAADVAAEREDRRSEAGYVAPSSAAAFLALARATPAPQVLAETAPDAITRAYFAAFRDSLTPVATPPAPEAEPLVALLREADVLPESVPPALGPAGAAPSLFAALLAELRASDPRSHAARVAELGYLANVLMAGASLDGRAFRPLEAAEATLATCNLGLEQALAGDAARARLEISGQGAVKLFRLGWRRLHSELALGAAQALAARLAMLAPARKVEPVRAELLRHMATGKPWLIRPRLGELAGLISEAQLAGWRAALDECPARPGPRFIASEADLQAIAAALRTIG